MITSLSVFDISEALWTKKCERYFFFSNEVFLGNVFRAFIYFLGLAYCFIGLSAITARFFHSMENVIKQTREVVEDDPYTNTKSITHVKVWNYTVADITLLAFGTSFPQISLATIDAFQNLGQIYAGGLGPGTLVGSAAFDLFPIHAVCVLVPKAGQLKKISDIGVWIVELFWSFWAYIWLYIILEDMFADPQIWTPNIVTLWEALLTVLQFGLLVLHAYAQDKRWPYISLPLSKSERSEDWVSETLDFSKPTCDENDQYSSRSESGEGYNLILGTDQEDLYENLIEKRSLTEDVYIFSIWRQQFVDALTLESIESRKLDDKYLRVTRVTWRFILFPWRLLFAFVPPCGIAHGWVSFICSLGFITGIAYIVTKLTDLISCTTGINPYIIAFTALASGTSWPDLVASKIAAERQTTADSAIANITCSNSVNIYIGIGIPWLIDAVYNFYAYKKPLYIPNAEGLSFSLLVYFITSIGCIGVLVFRRLVLGAELGGPKLWAWVTSIYLMLLWVIFVVFSSLRVSGTI